MKNDNSAGNLRPNTGVTDVSDHAFSIKQQAKRFTAGPSSILLSAETLGQVKKTISPRPSSADEKGATSLYGASLDHTKKQDVVTNIQEERRHAVQADQVETPPSEESSMSDQLSKRDKVGALHVHSKSIEYLDEN